MAKLADPAAPAGMVASIGPSQQSRLQIYLRNPKLQQQLENSAEAEQEEAERIATLWKGK